MYAVTIWCRRRPEPSSKTKKEPRLSSWFFSVLALPILPSASACQVSRPEAGLTDLSRDGAGGVPNQANEIQKRTTAFVVVLSCWRYLFSRAVSSQVSWAEASLTDLSRDSAGGVPNKVNKTQKRTTAFVVVLSCWRYLFSRAVSSQVSWAEASLTSVFGMGTGGPSP